MRDDGCRGSNRQWLAGLFPDNVFGVPVGPVRIVLAAVPLLMLAMRGRRTPERAGKVRRRSERRFVRIDASGQSRGDFLEQPAVAVGIPERGVGTIAATVRIRAADTVSPRQKRL